MTLLNIRLIAFVFRPTASLLMNTFIRQYMAEKEKIKPNTIIQTDAYKATIERYIEYQSLASNTKLFMYISNRSMFGLKYTLSPKSEPPKHFATATANLHRFK